MPRRLTYLFLILSVVVTACGGGGGGGSTPPGTETETGTESPGNGNPPPVPQSVEAVGRDGQIVLTWELVDGADAYNVYWDTSSSVSKTSNRLAGVVPPFTHIGRTNGTEYFYVVTSIRNGEASEADSESNPSSSVSGQPVAIGSPTISQVTPGDEQNELVWDSIQGADTYNIYWSLAPDVTSSSNTISNVSSPYSHTGLMNDQAYYYRVEAVQNAVESAPEVVSSLSSVETAAPIRLACAVTEPNVMLLLDTSGSMTHIAWHQGDGGLIPAYDDSVEYTATNQFVDWSVGRWASSTQNLVLSSVDSGTCNPGLFDLNPVVESNPNNTAAPYSINKYLVEGSNQNGETKCLALPDILGNGRTWYTGNYLNYLFNYFNDGDDLTTVIPFKTRMIMLQEVANYLVANNPGVRYGITTFNNGNGGTIRVENGAGSNQVMNSISALSAGGSTPLGETMYEITRYFRGMDSYYNPGTRYTSPIQYRCQKNYVIVVTDGLPTSDLSFPAIGEDPDVDTFCPLEVSTCSLPNWDGVPDVGNTATFSDYFDDIVKFAYDVDMRSSGFDNEGNSFNSLPYPIQNIQTFIVGLSIDNSLLLNSAHYGSGFTTTDPLEVPPTHYFSTDDEAQLLMDLTSIMNRIRNQ